MSELCSVLAFNNGLPKSEAFVFNIFLRRGRVKCLWHWWISSSLWIFQLPLSHRNKKIIYTSRFVRICMNFFCEDFARIYHHATFDFQTVSSWVCSSKNPILADDSEFTPLHDTISPLNSFLVEATATCRVQTNTGRFISVLLSEYI